MKRFLETRGFTIVEMLVVISIISILMTLSLVGADKVRERSRDAKRKNDLAKAQGVLTLYYADKKTYPLPCLGEYNEFPCVYDGRTYGYEAMMNGGAGLLKMGYTDVSIQDEKFESGNAHESEYAYRYAVSMDGLDFELSAKLENENDKDLTSDAVGNGSDSTRYERGTDKSLVTSDCVANATVCPNKDIFLYFEKNGTTGVWEIKDNTTPNQWTYSFPYPAYADGTSPSAPTALEVHMQ